jgi:hypothetical protein
MSQLSPSLPTDEYAIWLPSGEKELEETSRSALNWMMSGARTLRGRRVQTVAAVAAPMMRTPPIVIAVQRRRGP